MELPGWKKKCFLFQDQGWSVVTKGSVIRERESTEGLICDRVRGYKGQSLGDLR